MGLSYARGTYIYPFFENRQNRFLSLENQHSAFLYRGPLNKINKNSGWYYESPSLKFYRERLEDKIKNMEMSLFPHEGMGAPIQIPQRENKFKPQHPALFAPGKCRMKAVDFLLKYKDDIQSLNIQSWMFSAANKPDEKQIFTTLLPAAAALKKRNPELKTGELLEVTITHCVKGLERVLRIY
jgi:hypothetical protein